MRSERVFGIAGGTGPESTIDYYWWPGATGLLEGSPG